MLAVIFVTVASISLLSAMLLVCVLLDERTGIKTGESVILMPLIYLIVASFQWCKVAVV
jgi:hypothetical protein